MRWAARGLLSEHLRLALISGCKLVHACYQTWCTALLAANLLPFALLAMLQFQAALARSNWQQPNRRALATLHCSDVRWRTS